MPFANSIVTLSAPSGTGKSSIIHGVMPLIPELMHSISSTTRAPRGDEIYGDPYYFYTVEEMKTMIAENLMAEYEEVYEGKYYGTTKAELQRIRDLGKVPFLDIDVHGALRLQKKYENILQMFIMPPDLAELRHRLEERHDTSEQDIVERLNKSGSEVEIGKHFNTILHNPTGKLDQTVQEVKEIILHYMAQRKQENILLEQR